MDKKARKTKINQDFGKPIDDKLLANEIKKADEERREAVNERSKNYQKLIARYSNEKPYRISPRLVIRNVLSDTGLRPIPTNQQPFWLSPDISIESSSQLGNPVANEENFIHARIWNFGEADAAPVKVEFFWADPSLGLSAASWNKILKTEDEKVIDSEWVEIKSLHADPSNPPSLDVRYRVPWIPQYINQGHECLLVQCTNWILDPIIHPKEPVLDCHVAQRNFHVEKVTAGQTIAFWVNINNIFSLRLRNQIMAKFERFKLSNTYKNESLDKIIEQIHGFGTDINTPFELRNRFKPNSPQFNTAQKISKLRSKAANEYNATTLFEKVNDLQSKPKIESIISEKSIIVYNENAEKNLGERLIANSYLSGKSVCEENRNYFSLHSLNMKPYEQRRLHGEITLPADAQAGEILTLNLKQEINSLCLGGYTYIFQIIK